MRLLNTSTLQLEEFWGSKVPGYAILSHRWENREVTLQDLRGGVASEMEGYAKIRGCCKQAAADGWKWVWIDSCCIDKTSSSELSETINSMFKFYAEAKVCYVYLSDVSWLTLHHRRYGLSSSKWFTRGWTLQELLAPSSVIFFDRDWFDIGTKESLKSKLSSITGIRVEDFTKFKDVCVARKMSWAARRETTRIEDRAYCLMGLFGINMPTLYGEGSNAFLRLQLEILSSTDDESIFAWTRFSHDEGESAIIPEPGEEGIEDIFGKKGDAESGGRGGLLGSSPTDFIDCGDARLAPILGVPYMERPPYSMTNKGICMEHLLIPFPVNSNNETQGLPQILLAPGERKNIPEHRFLSLLHCKFEGQTGNVAIPIFQGWGSQPAERITNKLYHIGSKKNFTKRTLYIKQRQDNPQGNTPSISDSADLLVRVSDLGGEGFVITNFWASWDSGVLIHGPGGGFKLSDIPSPSKGSKAAIYFASTKINLDFSVFLFWSKGPQAQVEPRDPRVPMDWMVPKLSADCSSDRISKSLSNDLAVSVAISPGFYDAGDGEDVYMMDIVINTPAVLGMVLPYNVVRPTS